VGYRITLSDKVRGDQALGRITSWNKTYSQERTTSFALTGQNGAWQECELRVVGSMLTMRINGIETPKTVLKDVRPVYSMDAMRDRVQGEVMMEVVVREDGTVGDVKVLNSIHPDLDVSAVAAAKQWLFRPAMKGNQPVAVIVTLSLSFKIFK